MGLLLSIDIGKGNIKLAEGSYVKDELTIEKTAVCPLPLYSIEGEHIINMEVISDAIKAVIEKERFKAKNAVVTINATTASYRDIDMPKANAKELDLMIKNELVQTYHVNETDVVQYKTLETLSSDSGLALTRYRVASMDARLVDGYHELMKSLKFKSPIMDINVNSMEKLFGLCSFVNSQPMAGTSSVFVDFGEASTTVYIYAYGMVQLFRHFNIGSRDIERIVSDNTLTPPEDIKRKKEEGYDFFSNEDDLYYLSLKTYFYNLHDELRKIIRFYINRKSGNKIDKIFIFGGGSNLKGLTNHLETNLNIPVEKIQTMSGVKGKVLDGQFTTYANAFGALIRY